MKLTVKASLLIVMLTGVSLFSMAIAFTLSSYEYEITEGNFGPITIGQSKSEIIQILKEQGEWPAYPERPGMFWGGPYGPIEREIALLEAPAIEISFGWKIFQRIEFENDKIVRFQAVYPRWACTGCNATEHAAAQSKVAALRSLEARTFVGQTRSDFLDDVSRLDPDINPRVFPTIVELEYNSDFHTPHWQRKTDYAGQKYAQHLMSNDQWNVYGMRDLAWYSWLKTPYKSRVRMHFKNDRLFWVQHYHSPSELP